MHERHLELANQLSDKYFETNFKRTSEGDSIQNS